MFNYEKLWKLLKENGLKKTDLKKNAGLTPSTLSKLSKNENVSMDVLNRICTYLECDIGDIIEHNYTPYKDDSTLGTFLPNKKESIHKWFSYLEGYSKSLVETELEKLDNVHTILDPFGGSGTTALVSVLNGLDAYYCEANPVMAYISEVKTSTSFEIAKSRRLKSILDNEIKNVKIELLQTNIFDDSELGDFGGFEKYFENDNLILIQKYITYVEKTNSPSEIKDILKIALASVAVSVSKMIRRGDLRFAKGKEISVTNKPFISEITTKLESIRKDISELESKEGIGKAVLLSEDARQIQDLNLVDAIITSPPYLNGTNYIRNTKLELKLLGFVDKEEDLAKFHKLGIVAGINNVSKNGSNYEPLPEVKSIYERLVEVGYDKRIPRMIAGYFNDMEDVFIKINLVLKDRGHLILDIGDSQFAGVHVPTHEILITIAEKHGFNLYSDEVIRSRKSKSGFDLTQRILRFQLIKTKSKDDFQINAINFMNEKNYASKGRNWGNQWHSLCSYRGKLKPAIASELIEKFTQPGEVVLDPMGGVGTIPFEANLQGRIGISNDLSSFASVVAKAKLNPPKINDVMKEMKKLNEYILNNKEKFIDYQEVKKFGLNKKIADYYHPETMLEILAAREYFNKKELSDSESLIVSCILHILHGNRPYALSRNSHPLTPYAPTGEFVYKNLISNTYDKISRMYNSNDFFQWNAGKSYQEDIFNLPKVIKEEVDIIITSPPFASSFKFYTQNWLRLWFSGWDPVDFERAGEIYFDDKQNKNLDIYYGYFEVCSQMLNKEGRMILHVGKTKKIDMAKELIARSEEWFDLVHTDNENVIGIENHGVVDKGATTDHQFIFLRKKQL